MKVGFTGTRHGCTLSQKNALRALLQSLDISEFHHGDCVGADAQAHYIVSENVPVHVHPGKVNTRMRAYCATSNVVMHYRPLPPLERNKIIVDMTDMLVACPVGKEEEQRSGTWSTVRYARKQGKKICLVFPDGTKRLENP